MNIKYVVEGTTLKNVIRNSTSGEDIIVPNGVTKIAAFAINNENDHASLIMPDSVKTLEEFSISGTFKKIVFSKNITSLNYLTKHLESIEPLIIPPKINNLCEPFGFCNFKEVVLPEGLLSLEKAFYNCASLKKVNLPSSLIKIGDSSFENCKELEHITLPPKIEYIGKKAFYNTKVTGEFFLPKTIKEIGDNAFQNKDCIFYIEGDGSNIKTTNWHHPQAKVYFNATKAKANVKSNISLDLPISNELLNRYQKALDGDEYEMYYLGYCYEYGIGVNKDIKKALYWYSEACIANSGAGTCALAKCYSEGKGVKQDYELALKYYLEASKLDNLPAMYNVGLCYEQGLGVKKSIKKALEYYQTVYDKGYKKAYDKIKKLK